MSGQEHYGQDIPPADDAELRAAMTDPFAHPDARRGAVVTVQHPHTAADELHNRVTAFTDGVDELSGSSDEERRGLAAHQPLGAQERPLSSYPDAATPAQVTVTYGRQEEDAVSEGHAARVPDEKWDAFVQGHEDADHGTPRRRNRVSGLIRSTLRRNRS